VKENREGRKKTEKGEGGRGGRGGRGEGEEGEGGSSKQQVASSTQHAANSKQHAAQEPGGREGGRTEFEGGTKKKPPRPYRKEEIERFCVNVYKYICFMLIIINRLF